MGRGYGWGGGGGGRLNKFPASERWAYLRRGLNRGFTVITLAHHNRRTESNEPIRTRSSNI